MDRENADLTRLLRAELTAVHQQFFHILALRQWRNTEVLDRIFAVDTEDFKNAMQIIDLVVERGAAIALDAHEFTPGSDIPSILRAELRMEEQLAKVIADLQIADPRARARLDRAAAPRQRYREWLEAQVAETGAETSTAETSGEMAALIAHLVALVEQTMLHAFLFRHRGRGADANNAWRLSGAAMLYLTALVKRGAVSQGIPVAGRIPAVTMASDPSAAFDADIALARRCAELARGAADVETSEQQRRLCGRIAEDCDLIAGMRMSETFPAVFGRSPVFEDFAATCERHLK